MGYTENAGVKWRSQRCSQPLPLFDRQVLYYMSYETKMVGMEGIEPP